MQLNQPYDPRYNAKVYIPKITEEQRLARATPLENLKGLRFRSAPPAAPVEVPTPTESVPQAPEPQDSVAPQDVPVSPQVPAPDHVPTALEVVVTESPETLAPTTNGHGHSPSATPYENDDPPLHSNIISFYRLPRHNAAAPNAMRHRGGGLYRPGCLRPHHASG